MIERKFIKHNVTEQRIKEYVNNQLGRAGIGKIKLHLTPLGEKIVVHSSNPGLVVGKEGSNIKEMTRLLKKNFKLENPQIEISEVRDPNSNAQIVADRVAGALERYGSGNFKGIMHRSIRDILNAGVKGAEIVISGKLPGSRAKRWRILSGYMKKCGDIAIADVDFGIAIAKLKSGVVGVKIKIMPSNIVLPDTIIIPEGERTEVTEEEEPQKGADEKEKIKEEAEEEVKEAKADKAESKTKKKKTAAKKTKKKKTAKKQAKKNGKADKKPEGTDES